MRFLLISHAYSIFIYRRDCSSNMGGSILEYSRNALLSIHHFMKFIPSESRNAHLHLSEQLWVKLASYNILKCIRGQRGGNHLRKRTIRVSETSKKQESFVLGDKGVNLANLLNIQGSTLNSTGSSPLATTVDNINKWKLKMIHVTIRSLRNSAHLIQLRELAVQQKLDVITVSETWLNSTVTRTTIKAGIRKPESGIQK